MIEKLTSVLEHAFVNMGYDKERASVSVSSRPELCDYQINSVFSIAKSEGKNPIELGEEIVSRLQEIDNFSDYFKSIEFCKPGFINITVSDKLISESLNEQKSRENAGILKITEEKTAVVDYGGPNIAKPLHVGHIRPAIIGQSIYNILNIKGYNTIGDVHLGDFGLQIGLCIYGLKERGIKPNEVTIELLQDIYPKMSAKYKEDENSEFANTARKMTADLQNGNEEYTEYYKYIYEESIKDIKRIYDYLDVHFDYWYAESDSHPYIEPLINHFKEKGVLETDDGALIVRVEKEDDNKNMPPLIIQAKSGAYLYATSDVATIYQRIEDFKPNYILYVVDDRQRLHFEQVFRACEKSGLTEGIVLEHDYFGTINGPDGKPFKTRSGETLRLDELIEMTKNIFISKKESNKDMKDEDVNKIVNSILKFADLQNNREKNYIFDIEKFADVNGKTGPYILYTALRIKKIIDANPVVEGLLDNEIYNEYDRNLRMHLLNLNNAFDKAANERMPHYIADYVYNLCVLTNNFYQNNHISSLEDETKKNNWIKLLMYTYDVINICLKALVIELPSEM